MTKPRLLDLSDGSQAVIDEADWPSVRGLTVYRGGNGYVYYSTWENGKSNPRTLHGFLMDPPKGRHVDHINGDKLDNRPENLQVRQGRHGKGSVFRCNDCGSHDVRPVKLSAGTTMPAA